MKEPLTPPNCDLRHFAGMTLEVERLRRSAAWRACKRRPELAFYMLNLWIASWHEVPAASLEDDDDALCDLAMCSPERWVQVRTDVLRSWVKCSDGRLYHPVVAEIALRAFGKSQKSRKAVETRWKQRGEDTDVERTQSGRDTKKGKEREKDSERDEDKSNSVGSALRAPPTLADDDDAIPLRPKPKGKRSTGCEAFDEAWRALPLTGRQRSSKAKALKLWRAHAAPDADKSRAVRAYLESKDARKDGGAFVPAFERWIRDRLDTWLDGLDTTPPGGAPWSTELPTSPKWWSDVAGAMVARDRALWVSYGSRCAAETNEAGEFVLIAPGGYSAERLTQGLEPIEKDLGFHVFVKAGAGEARRP